MQSNAFYFPREKVNFLYNCSASGNPIETIGCLVPFSEAAAEMFYYYGLLCKIYAF